MIASSGGNLDRVEWQIAAWTLGALSMAVSLISTVAEKLLRDRAPDLATYLPRVQIVMNLFGLTGFVLALIYNPLLGMDVRTTLGALGIVVGFSVIYVVGVMLLGTIEWLRSGKESDS